MRKKTKQKKNYCFIKGPDSELKFKRRCLISMRNLIFFSRSFFKSTKLWQGEHQLNKSKKKNGVEKE